MTGIIIAGAIVVAALALVAVGTLRLCWYSIPFSEWVRYEREKRRWKRRK